MKKCQHCDEEVDCYGTHGLSCCCSEGRHHRHAAVNSIIHRAFILAKIPSRLEPTGMSRADGKHPDGAAVVPWSRGQLLVWDATYPDTLAMYLLPMPGYMCCRQGCSCCRREESQQYANLGQAYFFMPVAIETLGVFGPKTLAFVKELGRLVRNWGGE